MLMKEKLIIKNNNEGLCNSDNSILTLEQYQ